MTDVPLHEAFAALCQSRAYRYRQGELTGIEAVDWLQNWAFTRGLIESIGQDEVQRIMSEAFLPYREAEDWDLSSWHEACTKADKGEFSPEIWGDGNEPTEGLTGRALAAVLYRNARAKAGGPKPPTKREPEPPRAAQSTYDTVIWSLLYGRGLNDPDNLFRLSQFSAAQMRDLIAALQRKSAHPQLIAELEGMLS